MRYNEWFARLQGHNAPSPFGGQPEMTANYGLSTDGPDLTLKEAQDAAQKDYARLLHEHSPSWTLDVFTATVRWWCTCNRPGPRNAAAMDSHIIDSVRAARGPTRPQRK